MTPWLAFDRHTPSTTTPMAFVDRVGDGVENRMAAAAAAVDESASN